MCGRWDQIQAISRGVNAMDPSSDRLQLDQDTLAHVTPILLKGLWLKKFQATFALRRITNYNNESVDFVFGATDANNYRWVVLPHHNGTASADLPSGRGTKDGALLIVSGTQTAANKPALTATDVLWCRVTVDGSTAIMQFRRVRLADQSAGGCPAARMGPRGGPYIN
jgi:hypothetical protein